MKRHVLILGAGFGGLELATRLSESLSNQVQVTLLDQSDSFIFGFAKFDILFGRRTADQVRLAYSRITKPGVEFRQERVLSIDPERRRVVTDAGSHEADILVVALGADYEPAATPGFVEDGQEYYSVDGAKRLRDLLPSFTGGTILIGILGVPFKCPPAPYEGAMLLHDYLVERGVRDVTRMEVITPMESPIPVSGETSRAIVSALGDRGIGYTPGRRVHGLDPTRHTAQMQTGEVPYDLFIGIPVHRAPEVVQSAGLTQGGTDGWVAVNPRTLETRYPGVYAVGDCADAPVPRAGVFAESAARVVAEDIAAKINRVEAPVAPYDGRGTCYIEFGHGQVGKVDADFLSGPAPNTRFTAPSWDLADEKARFAADRRTRWFGP